MQAAPRIALADDDIEMRQWLRAVLTPLGADIEEAADGSDLLHLLAAAEKRRFDLVITDVYMPTPSGTSVVAMARAAGFMTPFIVITSYPSEHIRRVVGRLRQTTLLVKPLERDEFLACVSATLAGKNTHQAPERASETRLRSVWSSWQGAAEAPWTTDVRVRCVCCGGHWPAMPGFDNNRAFFCLRCIEDASDDERSSDLGGGG